MKLVITAQSIDKVEEMLNDYFYSTTYKIIENKVMFGNPLRENTTLEFKQKSKRFQIYSK